MTHVHNLFGDSTNVPALIYPPVLSGVQGLLLAIKEFLRSLPWVEKNRLTKFTKSIRIPRS